MGDTRILACDALDSTDPHRVSTIRWLRPRIDRFFFGCSKETQHWLPEPPNRERNRHPGQVSGTYLPPYLIYLTDLARSIYLDR